MASNDSKNNHLLRRTLVPLLIVALPVSAMIAFIGYHKHTPRPPATETIAEAGFGTDAWPIFRGDAGLTGRAEGRLPKSLEKKWSFQAGNSIVSSAIAADNTVFVCSTDHYCYALAIDTGHERWRFRADDDLEASPLYHEGRLYIGSNSGTFYAIDAQDGTQLWSFTAGGKITGSANISEIPDTKLPVVLFGSYDNLLYCLNAESGAVIFKSPAESYINGSIAVADGAAFFGSCDANIYRVPLADPNAAQTIDAGSYVAANPAINDGVIFAGTFEGRFLAADADTRTILWQFDNAKDAFFSSPAVNEKIVTVGCRDKTVYCFDRLTGEVRWTFLAQGNFDSSPVICGDTIAIGCDDGRLYLLDADTGKERFSYTLGSAVTASPAIAFNRLFVGCESGLFISLGPADSE